MVSWVDVRVACDGFDPQPWTLNFQILSPETLNPRPSTFVLHNTMAPRAVTVNWRNRNKTFKGAHEDKPKSVW